MTRVTTARLVPVTVEMDGDELDAEDAWHLARHHGPWAIAKGAFLRFRFGDGFTNSRALALQGSLAVIPFLLALTGLAADLDQERPAEVVARTIEQVSPGHGTGDALARAVTGPKSSERAGEVALTLGLLLSLVSMTTAMGQVERGSNRIYGIRRDRRAVTKYGRAAALTAILAIPLGLGFLLLVAGGSFADAMTQTYDWPDGTRTAFQLARWPLGLVLLVFAIAVLLDHAPRRRQPALSWLALGAGVAVILSMGATAALAAYVHVSGSFGSTYGPLAGIVALLLWSLMSAIAFFYGVAICAQLEALRAGQDVAVEDDPGRPHATVV